MTLSDLKWAIDKLARAAVARQHADCDCHRRIAYSGPRATQSPVQRAETDEPSADRRKP